MRKFWALFGAIVGGVWWLLGFLGNLQTGQGFIRDWGPGVILAFRVLAWSQWAGLGIFIVGVVVVVWIYWGDSRKTDQEGVKNETSPLTDVHEIMRGILVSGARERERGEKAIAKCLDQYVAIHDVSHLMVVSLLKSDAHKLRTNYEVVELCEQLRKYGHFNPLDYWKGYVPDEDALAFLQALAYSPERITDDVKGAGVVHAAMEKWRIDHNYPEPTEEQSLNALLNRTISPVFVPTAVIPTFRVTALDCNIDGEEFVIHLLFQNDGESDRTILSIRAIYWNPDRVWKNGYMFLGAEAASMRLGSINNAFVLSQQSKQTVIYRIKVRTDFLKSPQAEFGLHIATLPELSGEPQDVHLRLMKVIAAPESAEGVNYAFRGAVNVSLDEPTQPL